MSLPSDNAEISPDTPTATIAVRQPAAISVFQRLWIDFSSSEPTPLAAAVDRAGGHLDEVLGELLALPNDPVEPNWNSEPIGALLDHIISTHHEFTKNALPALWKLLRQVIQEFGDRRSELHDIGKIIAPLFTELGEHLQKEEQILFPRLRQMEREPEEHHDIPESAMRVLEDEHDQARDAFQQLRQLTNDFRAPEDASDAYRSLYAGLAELGRDLQLHIHLENNILHPRTRAMHER